jgi:nitrogen fixation protein NifZ
MRLEYDYGDQVRLLRNIRNDGTFPGLDVGSLLAKRGSLGYVQDVGSFLQDQVIYAVHFPEEGRLVGCREEELQSADAPWTPSRFETRDKVTAKVPLGIQGRLLVEQGEVGVVMKVLRPSSGGVYYHVHFSGRNPLQVPETALELPETCQPSSNRDP